MLIGGLLFLSRSSNVFFVMLRCALGIFACRAYGLPPLEADLFIFGFALLIEVDFSIFVVVGWSLWSCILVATPLGRLGCF